MSVSSEWDLDGGISNVINTSSDSNYESWISLAFNNNAVTLRSVKLVSSMSSNADLYIIPESNWCGTSQCGTCLDCYDQNIDPSGWAYEDAETSECKLNKDGYFYSWETEPQGATESECCLNSNANTNGGYVIVNKNINEPILTYGILVEIMASPSVLTNYSNTFSLQLPSEQNQPKFCVAYAETNTSNVSYGFKTVVTKDSMTITVNADENSSKYWIPRYDIPSSSSYTVTTTFGQYPDWLIPYLITSEEADAT